MTKPLWAPWRLEYIQAADEQEGCVFCLAAEGDDEEKLVVHRGRRAFVLLNKFPYSSGHLMVAPFRHSAEFGELDDDEALEDTNESVINHRQNDILRVLTIFSVILLPLTLITGIFGMNVHFPGFQSAEAWWAIVGAMVAVLAGLLGFFRYKRWL